MRRCASSRLHRAALASLGNLHPFAHAANTVTCSQHALRSHFLGAVAGPAVLSREASSSSEASHGERLRRRRRGDKSGAFQQDPRSWLGSLGDETTYSAEEIHRWRAEFRFPRRQHSLAEFGYTDEELGEWRKGFDGLTSQDSIDGFDGQHHDRISKRAFQNYVSRKYDGLIPAALLKEKVGKFWLKFDRDHNDVIDFGEFMQAGLLFDVDYAKEKIRKDGEEATFNKYAADGFMAEAQFFQLMLDFRFFVATATDVRKLVRAADLDGDGLIDLSDFVQWVESGDQSLEFQVVRTADLRHLEPPDPPEG